MSKSIKLNEFLESEKRKLASFQKSKSVSLKSIIKIFGVVLGIVAATTMLTLAYNYETVFFKNILISFFIIGLIIFVKAISDQKTNITRVKK